MAIPEKVLERLEYLLSSVSVEACVEWLLSADTDRGLFLLMTLTFTSSIADEDLLLTLSTNCEQNKSGWNIAGS